MSNGCSPYNPWRRRAFTGAVQTGGKMTTSKDIARVAGVSQTTVSRVLHDHPKVKAETRERVLRVLEEMDYAPDGLARAMVTRKTGTIGVVVEDVTNPFYPEIVGGISDALTKAGQRLMLWNSREAGERGAVEAIRQRLVDGVIVATATPGSTVLQEAVLGSSPVVLMNRQVEDIACDRVTTDNVRGGRLVAEYFAGGGHERVGLISGLREASTAVERERGFRDGAEASGIEPTDALRQPGYYSQDRGHKAMSRLMSLPEPPTAVFCVNDLMAFGAINAARSLGVRVPEDVWVVGFDDIKMASWEIFDLTTVFQPIEEMAREAVRLLLDRLKDPDRPPKHLRLDRARLVVRGSTGHKEPG